jgi:hypothetical protein
MTRVLRLAIRLARTLRATSGLQRASYCRPMLTALLDSMSASCSCSDNDMLGQPRAGWVAYMRTGGDSGGVLWRFYLRASCVGLTCTVGWCQCS